MVTRDGISFLMIPLAFRSLRISARAPGFLALSSEGWMGLPLRLLRVVIPRVRIPARRISLGFIKFWPKSSRMASAFAWLVHGSANMARKSGVVPSGFTNKSTIDWLNLAFSVVNPAVPRTVL